MSILNSKYFLTGSLPAFRLDPEMLAHHCRHHDLLTTDGVHLVINQSNEALVGAHYKWHQTEKALVKGLDEVLLPEKLLKQNKLR